MHSNVPNNTKEAIVTAKLVLKDIFLNDTVNDSVIAVKIMNTIIFVKLPTSISIFPFIIGITKEITVTK